MSMLREFERVVFSQNKKAKHLVVAGVVGKRIRVRGCFLGAAAANVVHFGSDATLIAPAQLSASFTLVLPPTDGGVGEVWFETLVGEALYITLQSAVQVDGLIMYDVV